MSDQKGFSLPSFVERFKDKVDGVGHALLGDNFEGFVDQEIRDVTAAIRLAKERKEEAKANRVVATAQVAQSTANQKELEEQALKFLRGHRKSKARDVAKAIAELLSQRQEWEEKLHTAQSAERHEQSQAEQLERKLKLLKLKLGAYKASANLQRTQDSLVKNPGAAPAMPETALKSAQRLRQNSASSPPASPEPLPSTSESAEQVLSRLQASLSKPSRTSRKTSDSRKSK